MAITKDKKGEILAKLSAGFTEATSIVFVRFNKLTVADVSKVRKALTQQGVKYMVAKKTLIRRALALQGYAGEVPELPGEMAVVWGKADETLPARGVYEFAKKLKEALTITGGVFERTFADAKKMMEIATIPPVLVLRGMFVNVINSPIQGFVMALDQIAKKKA